MSAYYNEFDPGAANWLRELMTNNLIAPGIVDERSIKDVQADDLRGFTQCHFFAGIGGWPHALRRAGWSDDRPVGSASCPCQGFSLAGKGLGFDDPRHLWPDFYRLLREARRQGQRWTDTLFGEQVASALAWLDLVSADLEAAGYAFSAIDLCAAGFSGAHIRQRLFWVADADNAERWADLAGRDFSDWPQAGRVEGYGQPGTGIDALGLEHAHGDRQGAERRDHGQMPGFPQFERSEFGAPVSRGTGDPGGLAQSEHSGCERGQQVVRWRTGPALPPSPVDWLGCRDGSWRPVEAGTFPLAPTSPGRVGLLRGYGNGLDAETAVNFVSAFLEAELFS